MVGGVRVGTSNIPKPQNSQNLEMELVFIMTLIHLIEGDNTGGQVKIW